MVKKILSSMILIMIICSTFVYSTEPNTIVETTTPSLDTNIKKEEDKTTNNESEKENEKVDEGSNDNINTDKTDNNSTNSNENSNDNEPKKDTTPTQTNNNKTNSSNTIQKSNEAGLKELKLDQDGLTPEFDKNITEYYLIVDLTVKQIKISANAVDTKAKVTVLGNKNLKEGQNTITVKVKAEDGTEKKYFIYVTKVDNVELANAELENLDIEGYSLYPSFKSNIYSYNLNINQNITSLNITPTTQRENATVVIEGNTNLQKGENIIKVIVTAEDNTTIRTYKINTYVDSKKVEIEEENKMPAIILIAGLSACIIVLGIYIIVKKRR